MQEILVQTSEWLDRYAVQLHLAASIVGIVVLALVVRALAGKALRLFFERVGDRAALVEERRRIDTLARVTLRVVSLTVVLVAAMLVLSQLGISIAPILGAAGVVGIAVGFGAQSLVKDVFTGVVLLVENQIRVGDVVEIAGLSGVVEEITLRRVKLRSYDGSVHYISNGLITTVSNSSSDYGFAVMDVAVDYHEDVDTVYAVLREVAQSLQQAPEFRARLLGELEISGVDKWSEASIVIRCRIKTQPLEQWGVRREFLKRLKAAFEDRGIAIPLPHRRIVPVGQPALRAEPADAGPDDGVSP